ncbi:unnamed protein product [Colias eurytheme]|nr:unnamed protein product [Colias eurytheme]
MTGRSDASTSTDDVLKGRPLCLFYFTHPFGVLSPEPPTITAAPPHIARTYINMEPAPFWPSSDDYESSSSQTFTATVPKNINLRSYIDLRRESMSSLFSNDIWLSSSDSTRFERRIPYNKLPPLQFPTRDAAVEQYSPEVWPRKCYNPERFSLPPIELPADAGAPDTPPKKCRRELGVKKRRRLNSVRKMMTGLMRRNVKVHAPE